MPSGLKRYYGSGDIHFITASCYQRQPLLGSARRRDVFVKVLEQVRQRYQFVIVGYVVMPEHFHLLISEPEKANPSVVIQALKLGVVRRLFPTSPKTREKWGTPSSRTHDCLTICRRGIFGSGASTTSTFGRDENESRS